MSLSFQCTGHIGILEITINLFNNILFPDNLLIFQGWNDVGFHGANDVSTPNIDALAYSGLILNSHYSEAICTPSRAALLTGKYPIHTGTQHGVIMEGAPWGLPLDQKLLPQYLNKLGYSSHAFGKWHLGYYRKEYTPTYRGFKTHYGFWNGYQDYFSHIVQFAPFEGFDMRRNMTVDWSSIGHYTTRLITKEIARVVRSHNASNPLFLYVAHLAVHAANYEVPLQAPQSSIDKFKHLEPVERRIYAAMLWELDQSLGKLVQEFKDKGILDDTIIVFLSDNGAATKGLHKNHGSNWPLKGEKITPWEGGLRTVSFVWSPILKRKKQVLNNLMHITDWLPTLFTAAGGNRNKLGDIDGVDQWDFLNGNSVSPRNEILHNIDDAYGYSALRSGEYKYVNGSAIFGHLDNWVGRLRNNSYPYDVSSIVGSVVNRITGDLEDILEIEGLRMNATVVCSKTGQRWGKVACRPMKRPCLFNIAEDPCERVDLWGRYPEKVAEFEEKLKTYRRSVTPPGNKRVESKANPCLHNNTWTDWADYD
ncbi:hypothetical protein AAG570_005585 [Ranatra chinensis]|uniref:Sulfatase N-terminal domain-containing protein n=1 Tax=Ranatra chinensis TaxID=642074 RepID=A0ABD0YLF6_9HEMI